MTHEGLLEDDFAEHGPFWKELMRRGKEMRRR